MSLELPLDVVAVTAVDPDYTLCPTLLTISAWSTLDQSSPDRYIGLVILSLPNL